ncbi:MAG: GTPase Era [bacterium]
MNSSKPYPTKSGYISIIGCPNVGKSTLLNVLVGERLAIVTHKPQTTRDKILGIRTENHAQMIFLDTPGIHVFKTKLSRKMTRRALDTIRESDVVLFVIDASNPFQSDEEEYIYPLLRKITCPVILIINKVDLISKQDLLPLMEKYHTLLNPAEIFPVSALHGENMDDLIPRIIQYLPQGPFYYSEDTLTDKPVRFIIAEIIREKIICLTQQEIPFSTAVMIESFQEDPSRGLTKISATILVMRDSQKGIIIGKQGSMLKNIGQQARQDIEKYLNTRVFLQLWVKVSKDWPDNEKVLRELGY